MLPFSVMSHGRVYIVKAANAEEAERHVSAQTGFGATAKLINRETVRWKKRAKNRKRKEQREAAWQRQLTEDK